MQLWNPNVPKIPRDNNQNKVTLSKNMMKEDERVLFHSLSNNSVVKSRFSRIVRNSREFSLLDLVLEAFWFHFPLLEKEWKHFFSLCTSRKRVKAFCFHFSLLELQKPTLAGPCPVVTTPILNVARGQSCRLFQNSQLFSQFKCRIQISVEWFSTI